jgi:hypothetical protein
MLRMHEPVDVSVRTRVSPVIFPEATGPGTAVLFRFQKTPFGNRNRTRSREAVSVPMRCPSGRSLGPRRLHFGTLRLSPAPAGFFSLHSTGHGQKLRAATATDQGPLMFKVRYKEVGNKLHFSEDIHTFDEARQFACKLIRDGRARGVDIIDLERVWVHPHSDLVEWCAKRGLLKKT